MITTTKQELLFHLKIKEWQSNKRAKKQANLDSITFEK
jgi:hypothetical protein